MCRAVRYRCISPARHKRAAIAFSGFQVVALDQHVARATVARRQVRTSCQQAIRHALRRAMSSSRGQPVQYRHAHTARLSFLAGGFHGRAGQPLGLFDRKDETTTGGSMLPRPTYGLGPAPSQSAGRSNAWPHRADTAFMGPSLICGQNGSQRADEVQNDPRCCGYMEREFDAGDIPTGWNRDRSAQTREKWAIEQILECFSPKLRKSTGPENIGPEETTSGPPGSRAG